MSRGLVALAPSRLLGFSPEVRRVLRVDVSVMLLFTVFSGLTAPFNGLILRRDLGATPFQLSVFASGSAACLLLSLAAARFVDSRRPLPWVVWPGFLARALFLLVPFIHSAWPFVGVLVGANLLGTAMGPASTALVQQVYPRAERGRAIALVRVTGAVLAIALALAAGALIGRFTYRWVFFAAALLGMAASLRQRHLPVPAQPDGGPDARPSLRAAWAAMRRDRRFRGVLVGSFVFGSGVWLMMPATPIMLADVLHATTAQVGILAAAAAVAALFGNVIWGRLVDKNSALAALRTVYLVGALTPLIYFVARHTWVLAAASVAESLMATGLDLVWMLVVIECAGPRRSAQYAAIGATLAGVRGVIGPLLGAFLIETSGVRTVYLVAAALMAGGALLVHRQLRHEDARVRGRARAHAFAR